MATNKDIIERLNCIEQNISSEQLEEIHSTVKEIKEILLDPEDGLVVRINKNTSFRKNTRIGLWAVFTAIGGLITEMILRK